MDFRKHQSLYNLAQRSLTVSLLKLRHISSSKERNLDGSFSLPELVERIKICKGIEVIHLISALPQTGLRPDLLELLESYHPAMGLFLEKYWKEVCDREFPRIIPDDPNESWLQFYRRQLDSSKSKILEAGSRLRDSYRGEERKVHQLQTISVTPLGKRSRPLIQTHKSTSNGKRMSLMEKSRQEALNSSARNSNKSPNNSSANGTVTFRMRQPSQKR